MENNMQISVFYYVYSFVISSFFIHSFIVAESLLFSFNSAALIVNANAGCKYLECMN